MHFPCPSPSRFLSLIGTLSSLPILAWGSSLQVRQEQPRGYDNERNFRTISNIYNLTVYPNQLPILGLGAAGVPPGLFAQNVTGRVDPVGQFTSFVDSIEYFFALSPLPTSYPSGVAITGMEIVSFTSACPEVAASVVYLYCSVANPCAPNAGVQLAPLKQVAFWKFDEAGAVSHYDAWIPNLNNWVAATTGFPLNNREFQLESIRGLCAQAMERCQGPYKQWDSTEACIADLSQRRYGDYNEAWGDNVVCRTIHLALTVARPDHHCPHVGPTGGGKCIDVPYPNDYFNDKALYGDEPGDTFRCPAKKPCGSGSSSSSSSSFTSSPSTTTNKPSITFVPTTSGYTKPTTTPPFTSSTIPGTPGSSSSTGNGSATPSPTGPVTAGAGMVSARGSGLILAIVGAFALL